MHELRQYELDNVMTTVVLAHVFPVGCFFARIPKTYTQLLRIPRCQAQLVEVSSNQDQRGFFTRLCRR